MQMIRSGELTLPEMSGLTQELRACLESGEPVVLNLEAVTEVDLACLQVLLAAGRSFAALGHRFEIRPGECVRQAWTDAGFPAQEENDGQDHPDGR